MKIRLVLSRANWLWWLEASSVDCTETTFNSPSWLSSLKQSHHELTFIHQISWWISRDWSRLKWWSLCSGLDPYSLIEWWCCRRGVLDTTIADLDQWVLVWVRRRRDLARLDWVGDIVPLGGCLYHRWGRIWLISAASWRGQRYVERLEGTCGDGQESGWHDGFGSTPP